MNTISMSVMISCLICGIMTTLVPIIVSVVLLVRKKLNVLSYFVGVLAFFISQICLRIPIMNVLSLAVKGYTEFTSTILGTILVGGLSAGLFEETARLIGAKILLKKNSLSLKDGISFGIGHSFCEAIIIVGIGLISYLILFIMINTNTFQNLMMSSSSVTQEQYNQTYKILTSMTVLDFIYGLVERCSAIMFHIMNSLIVFYGVKSKKYGYYILAILLHTVFNSVLVILAQSCGYLIAEIFGLLFAIVGLTITLKKIRLE